MLEFYLSVAVVFNLGQVISKLFQTPLQVWSFCVCIRANLLDQHIRFVSDPGRFTGIGGKQLAHLSKVFLHIGDVFLDLSRLAVPGGGKGAALTAVNN